MVRWVVVVVCVGVCQVLDWRWALMTVPMKAVGIVLQELFEE